MICPVCKNKFREYIKAKGFEVEKCEYCGLGVTKNLEAQKGNYHRDTEYFEEEKLFRNIFTKRAKLIKKIVKKGNVLEIGCSTGTLLSLLKNEGFNVAGVEISKPAVKLAKEKGIVVYEMPFEKFELNKKFDCIIFSHTLEHLENPFSAIKKANSYLEKKGFLFIDLPNFSALSLKILKQNWPQLLPKEHLWHFTFKSLDIFLSKNNLKIEYSDLSSGVWDVDDPIEEIFTSLFSFKKRFFMNFLTLIPAFILTKLKLGTGLLVIAKKV